MQLVAYRNTMRNAVPVVTEEQRMASQIAFLERRKAALSAELKQLVKDRANAVARIAYARKMALAKGEREAAAIAANIEGLEERKARLLSEINILSRERYGSSSVLTLPAVAERICKTLGVTLLDLCSDCREQHLVFARHAVCYWAFRRTRKTDEQIARFLGGRDRTTVVHGRKAYVEKRAKMGRTLREVR